MGPWVAPLAAVLSAMITAYLGYRAQAGKTRIDLSLQERKMLSDDAAALRRDLREQITSQKQDMDELRKRLQEMEKRVRDLERENEHLRGKLRDAGIDIEE